MMHDFEQFDDAVVRDLFYICRFVLSSYAGCARLIFMDSLHVPEVPLLFLLSLSSPPAPSYLHTTYPRSMLSLMRLQIFSLPSGIEILEKLVEEVPIYLPHLDTRSPNDFLHIDVLRSCLRA